MCSSSLSVVQIRSMHFLIQVSQLWVGIPVEIRDACPVLKIMEITDMIIISCLKLELAAPSSLGCRGHAIYSSHLQCLCFFKSILFINYFWLSLIYESQKQFLVSLELIFGFWIPPNTGNGLWDVFGHSEMLMPFFTIFGYSWGPKVLSLGLDEGKNYDFDWNWLRLNERFGGSKKIQNFQNNIKKICTYISAYQNK